MKAPKGRHRLERAITRGMMKQLAENTGVEHLPERLEKLKKCNQDHIEEQVPRQQKAEEPIIDTNVEMEAAGSTQTDTNNFTIPAMFLEDAPENICGIPGGHTDFIAQVKWLMLNQYVTMHGHQLCQTGCVIWCSKCGVYNCQQIRKIGKPCTQIMPAKCTRLRIMSKGYAPNGEGGIEKPRRMKLLDWFQWRADRTGTVFEADAISELRSLELALHTNGLQLSNEEGINLLSD